MQIKSLYVSGGGGGIVHSSLGLYYVGDRCECKISLVWWGKYDY